LILKAPGHPALTHRSGKGNDPLYGNHIRVGQGCPNTNTSYFTDLYRSQKVRKGVQYSSGVLLWGWEQVGAIEGVGGRRGDRGRHPRPHHRSHQNESHQPATSHLPRAG